MGLADPCPDAFPPPFAGAWGDDAHGLWAEIELFSEGQAGGAVERLRWIEPGLFQMGSLADEPEHFADEGPHHTVTLTRGFWLTALARRHCGAR